MDSSPEQPLAVRVVSQAIGGWIGRLGRVWIEGQVAQISRRPGARVVFLTLRDKVADLSLNVVASREVLEAVEPLADGATIIVQAQPQWYATRGTLSLNAIEIRAVGIGELLARLEHLKRVLVGEGLTDRNRKKPLPFLPRRIGLITGRASAAEKDVVDNATLRWPGVQWRIEEVPVQGPLAVSAVIQSLQALDRDPEVDVIVIARGGGSIEDLLPFSDEALCRAVAAMRTPVVSAIGHEVDNPLVDLVADLRASTPTDAAKRIVPDVRDEVHRIAQARSILARSIERRLDREYEAVDGLRSRARRCIAHAIDRGASDITHTRARLRALSPQSTLDRGYAVVQAEGHVLTDGVASGTAIRVRLARATLDATVD